MKVRDIIKYLVQPNFSWFETICIGLGISLFPTFGVFSMLIAIPTALVSVLLQEHFN